MRNHVPITASHRVTDLCRLIAFIQADIGAIKQHTTGKSAKQDDTMLRALSAALARSKAQLDTLILKGHS